MLISLHLPKTAGTSLADSLRSHFGDDLWLDYSDMPMQIPRIRREALAIRNGWLLRKSLPQTTRCVHGHFLVVKYALACAGQNAKFVTWLRDPIQRLVSHYYFWRRDFTPDATEPLRRKVVEENWSLERFCLGPELRNIYSKYLWTFNPGKFDFIGITENYAEDSLDFAARYLKGTTPAQSMVNANPKRSERGYELESKLRRKIESHHARDVALYDWAVMERARRIASR